MTSKITGNLPTDGEDGASVKDCVAATNITVNLTGTINSASAATVTPTNNNPIPSGSASEYQDMIKGSGVALFVPPPKKLKYSSVSSKELEGLYMNTHESILEILKELDSNQGKWFYKKKKNIRKFFIPVPPQDTSSNLAQ